MADETREARWAVTEAEMGRIETLRSGDELMATYTATDGDGGPVGDTHQVVVLRDGTVTNRNWDGTLGVSEEVSEMVGDEDELYHPNPDDPGEFEATDRWVDVTVGPEGEFVSLRGQSPAP